MQAPKTKVFPCLPCFPAIGPPYWTNWQFLLKYHLQHKGACGRSCSFPDRLADAMALTEAIVNPSRLTKEIIAKAPKPINQSHSRMAKRSAPV